MLSLPLGVVVGEVVQPDLLVLSRGIEGGAVLRTHAAIRGDRVEDCVALFLRTAVGHSEDAVGPVLVGRALVAGGDATEGGHALARRRDLLVGYLQDDPAVVSEPG